MGATISPITDQYQRPEVSSTQKGSGLFFSGTNQRDLTPFLPAVRKVTATQPKPIRRRSSISLAALLIFFSGVFASGLCLYQAKPSWHPAVRPIQNYRVGQSVRSENPTGEEDFSLGDHVGRDKGVRTLFQAAKQRVLTPFCSPVDPLSWRKIVLLASKVDGSTADVELLRPLDWLVDLCAEVGGTIELQLAELGIEGPAKVLAIEPCPIIRHNRAFRIVTGTFKHHAGKIIELGAEKGSGLFFNGQNKET